MAGNEHFGLSEDGSLTSLRQPWVSWFNRQMKLSITGVAVKTVTMTTNNITTIHKENTSSGFQFWGVPNESVLNQSQSPATTFFFLNLAIIAVCSWWSVPKAAALNESSEESTYWMEDGSAMGMKSGQISFLIIIFFLCHLYEFLWWHNLCKLNSLSPFDW